MTENKKPALVFIRKGLCVGGLKNNCEPGPFDSHEGYVTEDFTSAGTELRSLEKLQLSEYDRRVSAKLICPRLVIRSS